MSHEEQSEHTTITDEVLVMQEELATLLEAEKKSRQRAGRFARVGNRALLYLFLGPRLTHRLSELLYVAKERKEPILGTSLARVLDSASRRMTGYKRWAVIFGLIAAIPGIISITLLWQQNKVVKRETENTLADIGSRERLDLLLTIYTSEEKDPESAVITPTYSATLRSEAALKLIKMDTEAYNQREVDPELPAYWRVDLSHAPFAKVTFSDPDPNKTRLLSRVSFNQSNFFKASFSKCILTDGWFDGAVFIQTDFSGCKFVRCTFPEAVFVSTDLTNTTFENCDLKGAKYDKNTLWPDGFDPKEAGAILMGSGQEGDAP
jgi:hypothetical protein